MVACKPGGSWKPWYGTFPCREQQYLLTHSTTILDWGCALGDGVAVLGETFPLSPSTGLDFAEAAIAEVRHAFTQHEFLHVADGEPDREYDVIVTSNCLEHFDRPLDVVKSHLHWCCVLHRRLGAVPRIRR